MFIVHGAVVWLEGTKLVPEKKRGKLGAHGRLYADVTTCKADGLQAKKNASCDGHKTLHVKGS